jgi:putative membrane protein
MYRAQRRQRTILFLLFGGLGACASTGSSGTQSADLASTAQSDERTLAILHRSDVGEIAAGMMAQERATDPSVKAFAMMMVSEHTKLDEEGNRLAQQIHASSVLPDSTLPMIMRSDSTALRSAQAGAEFDRTYIAQQVAAHQRTLEVVDAGLTKATDAQVKTALQSQVRPAVARHLAQARQIQTRLNGSTASRGLSSPSDSAKRPGLRTNMSGGSVTESPADSSTAPKKP